MSNLWQKYSSLLVLAGVGLVALMLSIYIVPEGEQAVVLRTGEPVGTVNTINGTKGAGLYLRIPFVDTVRRVDKRVLDLEMTDEEVLSQDQQRLLVNAYARFRIVDPVRMVERAGTTDGVRVALEPILNSVLRQELGRRTFQAMLTAERGSALAVVRTNLDRQARQYGAEVIDVQIKRTDLPDGAPLQSAFQRMETDREREARTIRAQGSRDARIIRAEADAQAARVYATAFGKDADFYDFYRAMQSYDATFGATDENGQPKSESNIILSPDNEYLRQFRGRR
ncbi:protease modulator HflC [Erythrobacter sp. YJ-T3-07]|uniref:protease modulator HflC n=1 Tax=Erythrobacter sp. YJ-T3-07 TaxID=2793063 RepID=UPI0018D40269|nr:protease modulator HflC [Erythrobacter sp. YJ-T3-07]MBH1945132.1 protease modulator HflC [Erythrobacter sp. YJ-T3-07]